MELAAQMLWPSIIPHVFCPVEGVRTHHHQAVVVLEVPITGLAVEMHPHLVVNQVSFDRKKLWTVVTFISGLSPVIEVVGMLVHGTLALDEEVAGAEFESWLWVVHLRHVVFVRATVGAEFAPVSTAVASHVVDSCCS